MVQAAGRGPRLVQSWPAPLQNERLSLGPWGEEGVGWVAGGKQGWISFMWTATPVAEQAPSDRHLGRTTGRTERSVELGGDVEGGMQEEGEGEGGVMRPRGSVIRSVAERKMTAPRTEERQVPVGQRPRPPTPLGLYGDWWDVSVLLAHPPASPLASTRSHNLWLWLSSRV